MFQVLSAVAVLRTLALVLVYKERGREGGREGEREGGRDGGREGGREGERATTMATWDVICKRVIV